MRLGDKLCRYIFTLQAHFSSLFNFSFGQTLVDDSIISAIPLFYISACRHIFVNGLRPADIATNERFLGDIASRDFLLMCRHFSILFSMLLLITNINDCFKCACRHISVLMRIFIRSLQRFYKVWGHNSLFTYVPVGIMSKYV